MKAKVKKAIIVFAIVVIGFILFTLLMAYLILCGVASGLEIVI